MSKHFIKNIAIKHFKCFDDLNVDDLKRVNLIGGKNNIGKTSFMEACYIHLEREGYALIYITMLRNKRNYLHNDRNRHEESIIRNMVGDLLENKFEIKINKKEDVFNYKNMYQRRGGVNDLGLRDFLPHSTKNIIFLGNETADQYLEKIYGILQESNQEDRLNAYIHALDPSIKNFKFIQSLPKLQVGDQYIHLSNFGDGIKTYIAIICAIFASKNGQLFIDEIENGLHYSKLDELWRIILVLSKKQNVQVFATTHSKECIESYARISQELNDKEIRFIELGRNNNNKITAITYNFSAFMMEVAQEQEIRGW